MKRKETIANEVDPGEKIENKIRQLSLINFNRTPLNISFSRKY